MRSRSLEYSVRDQSRVVSELLRLKNRLVGGSETRGDNAKPYEPATISFLVTYCILVG
jgi:hypothetical protein